MENQGNSNNNTKVNKFSPMVLLQLLKRLKRAPKGSLKCSQDVAFLATEIKLENEMSIEEELASEKIKDFRRKYSTNYAKTRSLTVYDFLGMKAATQVIQ